MVEMWDDFHFGSGHDEMQMLCLAIHKLRVFDIAHYNDRGREYGTLLSLDIDGTKVYSIALSNVVTPSSGENTVGMFRNDDKQSLYAWLDPVSGTCYIPSQTEPLEFFRIGLFIGLVAGAVSRSYGCDQNHALITWSQLPYPLPHARCSA